MSSRTLRVDPRFFTELDAQLNESRGPDGEPSASDFVLVALPTVSGVFARTLDQLPTLYPDHDDYRYLVATGLLVRPVNTTAQLGPDGSIVLFGIDLTTTRSACTESQVAPARKVTSLRQLRS